jgi:hypothetical protein
MEEWVVGRRAPRASAASWSQILVSELLLSCFSEGVLWEILKKNSQRSENNSQLLFIAISPCCHESRPGACMMPRCIIESHFFRYCFLVNKKYEWFRCKLRLFYISLVPYLKYPLQSAEGACTFFWFPNTLGFKPSVSHFVWVRFSRRWSALRRHLSLCHGYISLGMVLQETRRFKCELTIFCEWEFVLVWPGCTDNPFTLRKNIFLQTNNIERSSDLGLNLRNFLKLRKFSPVSEERSVLFYF